MSNHYPDGHNVGLGWLALSQEEREIERLNKQIKALKAENERLREDLRKYKSMCKAAAAEIDEHWQAHCDAEGYGPRNLVDRLSGRRPPDLYPGYDEQGDSHDT